MSKKLLPCPFCGGEAELKVNLEMGGTQYQVLCKECPTTVGRYWCWNEKEAIEYWNTRKPIEDVLKRMESFEKAWEEESVKNYPPAKHKAKSWNKAIELVKALLN